MIIVLIGDDKDWPASTPSEHIIFASVEDHYVDTVVSKCAAYCIRKLSGRICTATEWRELGGQAPLTHVKQELLEEISRQLRIRMARVARQKITPEYDRKELVDFILLRKKASPFSWMRDNSTGSFRVGKTLVQIARYEHKDWERYSKGWHRQYGPAISYQTTAKLTYRDGLRLKTTTKKLKSLSYVRKNVIELTSEFLGLPKFTKHKGIRLYDTVDLVDCGVVKHTKIYKRYFCGEFFGYVGVRRGTHYHSASNEVEDVIDGVREKLAKARLAKRYAHYPFDLSKPIGTILRSFGFCKEGTADALDMLGLENRVYSYDQLIAEADWDRLPKVAKKYPKEVELIRSKMPAEVLTIPMWSHMLCGC